MDDELLQDQIDYYRARAPEYDDWWTRRGRYDKGDDFARAWQAEVDECRAWLHSVPLGDDVLELAGGTGNWTVELARRAARVTVVDASPETLEINRAKVAEHCPGVSVDHVVADLFAWQPLRRFSGVFFSFWISHVPDERIVPFFEMLERAVEPGAPVAMLDNKGGPSDETSVVETAGPVDRVPVEHDGLSERELNDGRTFTIVKVYRSPERLAELLEPHGWTVGGSSTRDFFTWAVARRR